MASKALRDRIGELIKEHGGLRAAARAVDIDPSHLVRIRDGERNASDEVLEKLGLRRIETLERIEE